MGGLSRMPPQVAPGQQTVPMNMNITVDMSTSDAILEMINTAQTSIDFAVYYFSLLGGTCPSVAENVPQGFALVSQPRCM